MISSENKNLITIYSITFVAAVLLIVVIINFNSWFFPNGQSSLTAYTPAARGLISDKDLRFGVLSDNKFISLKPILTADQLAEGTPVSTSEGVTNTVTSTVSPVFELRHANPFNPF
jgi:hypothetical protein